MTLYYINTISKGNLNTKNLPVYATDYTHKKWLVRYIECVIYFTMYIWCCSILSIIIDHWSF